jgi:hypothetical protein
MKYKLIRNGVLTASTILFIGCLVKLLPNRNFQLFLIAGTLGSTGIVLARKERELQNVYTQVNDKILALENQEVDEKIAYLEQEIKDEVKKLNTNLADLKEKIDELQDDPKPGRIVDLGIIELLKCKGVEIEPTPIEHDLQLNQLANHIARNHNLLQDFRWRLIQSIENNHAFEYSLRNRHLEDIQIHTVFGSKLRNLGFPEYRYANNSRTMYIPACQDQVKTKLIQFLKGGWFEVYTLNVIIKYLYLRNNRHLKYDFLLNANAEFFKDNDNRVYRRHELDLLFLIENNLIWIECKSGRVQDDDLQKYSDNNQQFLKLPKQNALVDAAIKTQQYPGITIVNPNSLLQSIETILNNRPSSLSVQKSTTEIVDKVQNNTVAKIDNQPVKVGW